MRDKSWDHPAIKTAASNARAKRYTACAKCNTHNNCTTWKEASVTILHRQPRRSHFWDAVVRAHLPIASAKKVEIMPPCKTVSAMPAHNVTLLAQNVTPTTATALGRRPQSQCYACYHAEATLEMLWCGRTCPLHARQKLSSSCPAKRCQQCLRKMSRTLRKV